VLSGQKRKRNSQLKLKSVNKCFLFLTLMKFCSHIPTCPRKVLMLVWPPPGPGGPETLTAEGHFFTKQRMFSGLQIIPGSAGVVMGPGQKCLTRVGSIFSGSGWVSHLWFGFEFGKFTQKMSNFLTFYPLVKKNIFGSGRKVPRLKVGRVRAHL